MFKEGFLWAAFGLLLLKQRYTLAANGLSIVQHLEHLNELNNYELNVLLNIPLDNEEEIYSKIFEIKQPKLIISEYKELENMVAIYGKFTEQVLVVAGLRHSSIFWTMQILYKILNQLHYKDIVLICETKDSEKDNDLFYLFELCYQNGFTSVLVWCNKQLYSYQPYPSIQIVTINNLLEFQNKNHLKNFQQKVFVLPFVEFPPRCFSYRTVKGTTVRTGYFYKMCELFLLQHNASIELFLIDMWAVNFTHELTVKLTKDNNFVLLSIPFYGKDYFQHSKVIEHSKSMLILPSAKEIDGGLYFFHAFNIYVWCIILLTDALLFGLLLLLHFRHTQTRQLSIAFLQSWHIITYLPYNLLKKKTAFNFFLTLLFRLTGFFITVYLSSSLASLYASKIYETDIANLQQIERNNLLIHEYTAGVKNLEAEPIPAIVKQRIFAGNNAELQKNRKNLNVSKYMYIAGQDTADYILFQQIYLKRPFVTKLEQPLKYHQTSVRFPPNSPLINGFNLYLQRIVEAGLVNKFYEDSKWAGIISDDLHFFSDDGHSSMSLALPYFRYAFAFWALGMACAAVRFALECEFGRNICRN